MRPNPSVNLTRYGKPCTRPEPVVLSTQSGLTSPASTGRLPRTLGVCFHLRPQIAPGRILPALPSTRSVGQPIRTYVFCGATGEQRQAKLQSHKPNQAVPTSCDAPEIRCRATQGSDQANSGRTVKGQPSIPARAARRQSEDELHAGVSTSKHRQPAKEAG